MARFLRRFRISRNRALITIKGLGAMFNFATAQIGTWPIGRISPIGSARQPYSAVNTIRRVDGRGREGRAVHIIELIETGQAGRYMLYRYRDVAYYLAIYLG